MRQICLKLAHVCDETVVITLVYTCIVRSEWGWVWVMPSMGV